MNLPNTLTVLRVIMIPFFVLFMLGDITSADKYIALGIFIAASLTDTLDGYLARKNNQVTNFGKFMDPLADKLLVCAAMICLMDLDRLPSWIVIIIYHQRFSSDRCGQWYCDRGKLVGKSQDNLSDVDDHSAGCRFGRCF